jgi:hypothetical protein
MKKDIKEITTKLKGIRKSIKNKADAIKEKKRKKALQ